MEKERKGKRDRAQTGQRHYSQREHILAVMVQTGRRLPIPTRLTFFESGLQLLAVWEGGEVWP